MCAPKHRAGLLICRRAQSPEETLRPRRGGEGNHARARDASALLCGRAEAPSQEKHLGREAEPPPQAALGGLLGERARSGVGRRRERHDGVRAGEASVEGLAEWAGRQHSTVPEQMLRVDDEEREVAVQGRVLQTVVHQQDRGRRRARAGGGGARPPVGAYPRRRGAREQPRLVADPRGGVHLRRDAQRAALGAAVAAREDVGRVRPWRPQEPLGECEHQRRLARAARDRRPDADDGRLRPAGRWAQRLDGVRRCGVREAEWQQRVAQRAAAVPEERRPDEGHG
mmetsp:Transcript_5778/g.17368  ORF Transcript_5778/g.17368 Transcript_5778/m.17368 type:complete len:284 (-) Transcript_5778:78-929(-)